MADTMGLIKIAAEKLNRHTSDDGRLHGDVAAAVLAADGKIHTGVCVDTPGWGLCAERSALAAMITDGCYRFDKVVAVWRDDKTDKLHVLPPCGICRDFMQNIDRANMEADVILGKTDIKKLKDLIPYHKWPEPLEGE